MQKSKLIALALSAISTGILISCAKPASNADTTDKDNDNAKQTDNKANAKQTQTATEKETNTADKADNKSDSQTDNQADNQPNNQTNNTQAIQPIQLSDEQTKAYLQHLNKDFIIPLYTNSTAQSKALAEQAIKLCQGGALSAEQVGELRKQWLMVAKAWAKAEAINYGPAYENMNHLYINYFPDERGLVHKSVNRLIADSPDLKPEQFADESAIVQGIPALEDVLFSNDTLDKAQCNYLISATHELNRKFTDISNQWQKNGDSLLDTANPATGMNQFFNGLLFHIENLKSTGLDKPLALKSHKKGHLPAHKAGQSRAIIEEKLASLQEALTDKQLVALINDSESGKENGKEDGKKVLQQLEVTLKDTKAQLQTLPEDIGKADKAEQTKLYDNLTTLTKQLKRGIMPLLGVQLGFNSTDGD